MFKSFARTTWFSIRMIRNCCFACRFCQDLARQHL